MTTLVYITHPSVKIDSTIPIDQWGLSEKGWEQAERALNLDFWPTTDALYTSTELKAYCIAEKAAHMYHLPFDESHKVYDLGETRNRSFIPPEQFEEAVVEWYRNLDSNINGWEPINAMSKRVSNCIDNLMSKHTGQTVAIVGHGGSGTMVKCHIKNISPVQNEDPHQVAGGYFTADWDNKLILHDWIKY